MKAVVQVVTLAVALNLGGAAAAHHVGTYVPKDSAVSADFKQIKFAIIAGKFDVALRLFDEGALRAEMKRLGRRFPAGLEDGLRAALKARDARRADLGLMVFMLFVARDLAEEAERRLADASIPPAARLAQAWKLLEAVWRYYNLVDFAVYQRDVKAALGVRLAFDDAEGAVAGGGAGPTKSGGSPQPTRGNPCGVAATGLNPPAQGSKDPAVCVALARAALKRMSGILTSVIDQSAQSALAVPAGAGATRP